MEFVQDGGKDYSEDQEEDEEPVTTSNFFPPSSSCYKHHPWLHDSPSSRSTNYQSQSMELSLGSIRDEVAASEEMSVEREHMFDKVVTPSDVGKLNRLVIPKQHAEKYFPLDSSTNDKGLLLNFEDRNGKPWRFRYSYWNSSQSYVMTKGWSRFVKEKKLDAGDIVSFQRGVGDQAKDRLFIDWRRRPQTPLPYPNSLRWGAARLYSLPQPLMPPPPPHLSYTYNYNYNNSHYTNNYHNAHHPYHRQLGYAHQPPHLQDYVVNSATHEQPLYYLRSSSSSGMQQSGVPMVIDSVPLLHGRSTAAAAGKKLRLFGVNMECETADDGEESDRMVLPSTALLPHVSVSSASMSPQFSDKGKSSLSFDLDL